MSKFLNFIDKYQKAIQPIQMIIYIVVGGALLCFLIGVIFGFKSCSNPEVIEAKHFMTNNVEIHENFNIKVLSARTVSTISILKKENDTSKNIKNGNFIAIEVEISKNAGSTKEHKLDINDFKLKDHTGVYLPLNDIMSFFNIDAVDLYVYTDENGFIISDVDFSTKKAIKDFTWVNKSVEEEALSFTIYFEMKENYKVEEEIMVLEVDFYDGKYGIKKGEDIILVQCEQPTP